MSCYRRLLQQHTIWKHIRLLKPPGPPGKCRFASNKSSLSTSQRYFMSGLQIGLGAAVLGGLFWVGYLQGKSMGHSTEQIWPWKSNSQYGEHFPGKNIASGAESTTDEEHRDATSDIRICFGPNKSWFLSYRDNWYLYVISLANNIIITTE
jgi:hypothetical protein